MKTRRLFLFLVFSSLSFTLGAQTVCSKAGEAPLAGGSCCPELSLNARNVCEVPLSDPALKSCAADSECAGTAGMGCFRMSEDDLFSSEAQSPDEFSALSDQQDAVEDDREANGVDTGPDDQKDGLPDGAACVRSAQCDSYFCDPTSKACVEKRICRFGDLGEAVNPGVACEEGYVVNAQGVCDLSEEDKRLFYMGLLEGDVELRSQNKCSLKDADSDPVTKDIREKAIVSMKTLRAMEWLFATSSLSESDECLKVLPFLREQMALKFNEERKKILNNFNLEMSKIEKDSRTIESAKKGSETEVEVHGVKIKEGDLEARKHSGYDAMMIMYRRNLLFQAYEKAMKEIIQDAGTKIGGLAEEMGNWKDKSKKWTVGGKEWTYKTAGRCRGKKAKKIKKRWANYYQVRATTADNAAIVQRPTISQYLSLVSGDTSEGVEKVLTSGPRYTRFFRYFLVDPLMPGGKGKVSFERFGTGKKGKRTLGDKAYPELHQFFRERIIAFYKELKGSGATEGFVYEPEIITSEARDCIDRPEGPKCEAYTKFIDEMTDIAFAQFLAYSIHSRNSYKKYFPKSDNLRRKLLAKYEVDMQNVVKYYEAMGKARDDQSACLETSINSVAQQFLGDTAGVEETTDPAATPSSGDTGSQSSGGGLGDGSASGSVGGAGVAALPGATATGNGAVSSLSSSRSGILGTGGLQISELTRAAFSPDLRASGNSGVSSSASASLASASASSFAVKLANLKKNNALVNPIKANVANREKNATEAQRSLGQAIGGSSFSPPSTTLASLGFGGGGGAQLDVVPTAIQTAADVGLSRKAIELRSGGAVDNSASSLATVPAGAGTAVAGPSSGLSDYDIENIEQNYDRTRSRYASDPGDDLFDKVSKAYIRNLNRVLVRRKSVGDN